MHKRNNTQFNCFSPPIMIATFTIEMVLACYTIWRYKLTALTRLVVAALVALATFQFAEYFVCQQIGHGVSWSRLGYVAITTLPPLGLHILYVLARKPGRKLVMLAYASMTAFIVYFMLYHAAFRGYTCTGNYVIFQLGSWPARAYGVYYYGWLFIALGLGLYWSRSFTEPTKLQRKRLRCLQALMGGYLAFMLPVALANSVDPSTRAGVPSIMCGFAVVFALILSLYITPRAATRRR